MDKWFAYDTTLRDGLQENGRDITIPDATRFAQKLDDMGFSWIEAGFASAGKDQMDRIKTLTNLDLKNIKVSAFGRTRGKKETAETATDLNAILASGVKTATLVGKVRKRDVKNSLQTDEETNLKMISDSIKYLKSKGIEVIFDAEHFFDGIKEDESYTLKSISAAEKAGADWVVMCDTNGASTPEWIEKCIALATKVISKDKLGVHCHNDRGRAVANSEAAFKAGVRHIHGTINGYGERCGNADFCTLIPNLHFDYRADCLKTGKLKDLTDLSHMTAEFLNAHHRSNHPWVGTLAGHTEAGMHTSGILRDKTSYIHADLEEVGNNMSFGVSEQSGLSSLAIKAHELGFQLKKEELHELNKIYNEKLAGGYDFAGAEASFYLLALSASNKHHKTKIFDNEKWIVKDRSDGKKVLSSAKLEASLDRKKVLGNGSGNGPVDALNEALSKILNELYPALPKFHLTDYRVKIINPEAATGAKVRVIIESSNDKETWATVGVHENIIQASWIALKESISYVMHRNSRLSH